MIHHKEGMRKRESESEEEEARYLKERETGRLGEKESDGTSMRAAPAVNAPSKRYPRRKRQSLLRVPRCIRIKPRRSDISK